MGAHVWGCHRARWYFQQPAYMDAIGIYVRTARQGGSAQASGTDLTGRADAETHKANAAS